jgi:hypothetical protein
MGGHSAVAAPSGMAGWGGRPKGYCQWAMPDVVRHVAGDGVEWAGLPADFPPPYWRVRAFVRCRQVTGLLAKFQDRLRDRVREKEIGAGDVALGPAGFRRQAGASVGAGDLRRVGPSGGAACPEAGSAWVPTRRSRRRS